MPRTRAADPLSVTMGSKYKRQERAVEFTLQEYCSGLDQVGWLRCLTCREVSLLKRRLRKTFHGSERRAATDIYPDLATLVIVPDDCIQATGPDAASYYEIVKQYVKVSHGKFDARRITDSLNPEAGVAAISYELQGRLFSFELPYEDEWYEPSFQCLINQSLNAIGVYERFMLLPPVDIELLIVFILPSIYERAVLTGLIPRDVRC